MSILKLFLTILPVFFFINAAAQTIYPPQRALEKNKRNLANLRGKVINNSKQQRPYKSLPIDLYYSIPSSSGAKRWVLYQSTITDSDGFFYFKNVRPFAESKVRANNSKDMLFKINKVDKGKKYQDILITY